MELSDFEVGKTYQIKKKDWVVPDGSGTIPGNTIMRKILSPATKENSKVREADSEGVSVEAPLDSDIERWSKYLRVYDPENEHTHLLDPSTIESATVVTI